LASSPASPIPTTDGPVAIPPVAYHSRPNLGTLGGFKPNLPLTLKCGILSLGNSHLKSMRSLILFIAFSTRSLAFSIGFLIASLILFQVVVTFVFTVLNLVLIPVLSSSIFVLTLFQASLIGVVILVFTSFHLVVVFVLISFHFANTPCAISSNLFFKS